MRSRGLIFTAFEVEQFRRFTGVCRLEGLGAGLNVLAAPNEAGKSTMLAALRALFFCRATSSTQLTKSFEPYGGGAPRVRAEFTVDGENYVFEKQFLKRQFTRLSADGRQIEGDEANAHIHRLLGLESVRRGEADGLLAALWVEQGQSFTQPALCDTARQSVRSCLTQDFDEITGGADAGRILRRVREEISGFLNGHGKPVGRYAGAKAGEDSARGEIEALETLRETLARDIAALDQSRRLLEKENDPARQAAERQELEQARARKLHLVHFSEQTAKAQTEVDAALRDLQLLGDEQKRRAERRGRLTQAGEKRREEEDALRQSRERLHCAEKNLVERQGVVSEVARQQTETRHLLTQARKAVDRIRLRAEKRTLEEKLTHLEELNTRSGRARARLAACPVDDRRVKAIEALERAVFEAKTALDAQATGLEIYLEPEAAARVTLNGAPAAGGRVDLVDATELRVEGVGTFRIMPSIRKPGPLKDRIAQARGKLQTALEAVGCGDMTALYAAREQHRQAEKSCLVAEADLKAALPSVASCDADSGLRSLRQRIEDCGAVLESGQDEEQATPSSVEEAEARLGMAQEAFRNAEERFLRARDSLREPEGERNLARELIDAHQKSCRSRKEECDRLQAEEDAAQAAQSDSVLLERLDKVRLGLEEAERRKGRLEAGRPVETEALVDATIERLDRQIQGRQERLGRYREDHARLQAVVRAAEGEGLDEKIAASRRTLERHRTEREACEREIGALQLLRTTLEDAERETVERYFAPLTRAIRPAIEMLFPRADLRMNEDFTLDGLTRGRTEEKIEHLSDGTREQLAVLVRLGFADMLQAQGRPAMLVLDDALCFSDAARTDRLFDILTDAAKRMQIVIMTCRAEQFLDLSARCLRLETAPAV